MAPTRIDLEQGQVFGGGTGALARRWLAQTGLLRRSAFAYVEQHRTRDLTCRHCGADYWVLTSPKWAQAVLEARTKTQLKLLAKWPLAETCEHNWKEVHGGRELKDEEACGLPLVRKMLAQKRWRVVLCWGAVPARLIAGYSGAVGHMVGRFRTIESGQTVTVLYHTGYALAQRGSPEFGKTEALEKEVLRQVKDRLDHPEGKDKYPFIMVQNGWTFGPAQGPVSATVQVREARPVIDIETHTLGEKPDPRTDPPHTVSVVEGTNDWANIYKIDAYSRLVLPEHVQPLTHHAQFDLPIMYKLTGREDFTADDTMVEAYLLGHEQLSLKILSRRLLGRDAREFKEEHDDEYDAQDPLLTRELHEYLNPQIQAKGLRFLYEDVKTPLQSIMAWHVVHGLRIDQEKLQALRATMVQRAAVLKQRMFDIIGRPFNLGLTGVTDEVVHILFDELGLPPAEVRHGRTVEYVRTTGETHIGQFRHLPFVAALLAYRRATGYESRYTGPMSALKRVSGLYDLTGTGTDRVAQSRRNCMNFPGLVKQCIEADEGGYFVYGDYSQVELRYAAFFSKDPYLTSVIREGRNMHEELCLAVYGARTPETYTQAKSSNFAKLFGAGINRRAKTLKMPVSVVQANEIPWTGWDDWVARRRSEPSRTYFGYERNIDGHIESADEYLREKAYREVINSIIQGSAGETTQYAQVLAHRALRDLGGRVVHQEHDSVLGWVPDSIDPAEAKSTLLECMIEAAPQEIRDYIPIPAKVITGSHWG